MKKILLGLMAFVLMINNVCAVNKIGEEVFPVDVQSAVLMEKETGTFIYGKNELEELAPASVTKVMTLLLVMEEIERGNLSYDDVLYCSAHSSSMGGSQIWLEEGEALTVHELLKAVTVVSANDCAVCLAEHIAGSEDAFVIKMNERAKELSMNNTNFVDCTGLTDDKEHYTCAYDIALMSRELLKHEDIKKYTTIWMDSLRNGETELSNTNKLIRYYEGATGLKTGYTSGAMYCLSASAMRDGTEYIAVIMKAESSQIRFETAKELLNYGFANYTLKSIKATDAIPPVKIVLGEESGITPIYGEETKVLLEKSKLDSIEYKIELPEEIEAPISEGETLGKLYLLCDGEVLGETKLVAPTGVNKLSFWSVYKMLINGLF